MPWAAHAVGEVGGCLAVGLGEVVAAHPVDQVVHRVHAFAGGRDLVGVECIHDDGLYPVAPPRLLAVGVGRGGAHVVAAFEQQGHESTADVAGRAGHQDLQLVLSSPQGALSCRSRQQEGGTSGPKNVTRTCCSLRRSGCGRRSTYSWERNPTRAGRWLNSPDSCTGVRGCRRLVAPLRQPGVGGPPLTARCSHSRMLLHTPRVTGGCVMRGSASVHASRVPAYPD